MENEEKKKQKKNCLLERELLINMSTEVTLGQSDFIRTLVISHIYLIVPRRDNLVSSTPLLSHFSSYQQFIKLTKSYYA